MQIFWFVENTQRRTTAQRRRCVSSQSLCRLLSLFIAHLVSRIVSGVGLRVSVSFQIIPRVVGRLGSEVRVSVTFQRFAVRMFFCLVMFCRPVCRPLSQQGHFSVPPLLSFLGRPHNGAVAPLCAVACFLRTPTIRVIECCTYSRCRHYRRTESELGSRGVPLYRST